MAHELRCYEYVNHPYATVHEALRADLAGILARATKSAAQRADALAARLRVELAGVEVGTDVAIEVVRVTEEPPSGPGHTPSTIFELRWRAAHRAAVFPAMTAELHVYPLGKSETQLELRGTYRPPLGPLGTMIDGVVGHRIAEASVHRFVADIAELLKTELGWSSVPRTAHARSL
jgi:hypothetical protein